MPRCADCQFVADESDAGDEPTLRCDVPVPFWVPLPVHDYQSWVRPDDGAKCRTFKLRDDKK